MMLVSLTVFYALGASRTYFLAMFKMILYLHASEQYLLSPWKSLSHQIQKPALHAQKKS